jgi:hypothetical protein
MRGSSWRNILFPECLPARFTPPLDGVARLFTTLALVVATMAIGFLVNGWASSLLPSLLTFMEATSLRPSGAAVVPPILDRDGARRTNDDDYLDGLVKALDYNS